MVGSGSCSTALLTPSLLVQSAGLHADLAAIIERSRDLLWQRRSLRRRASPRLRQVCGGGSSAAVQITLMIAGASLCLDCIARKTGIPGGQVDSLLTTIGQTVQVDTGPGVCSGCLTATRVFRLATSERPTATSPRPGRRPQPPPTRRIDHLHL